MQSAQWQIAWIAGSPRKQAMAVLADALKREGYEQIKLRVAADNARARHVYEATGFQVTGINMSKSLVSE